jgi:glutamyl/glutaminyl-tRNA synthetase
LPEFSFLWIAPTQVTYEGPISSEVLTEVSRVLELVKSDDFNSASVSKSLRQFSKSVGIKFPVLMKCLRSVLSGLEDGPPVGEMIQLLGKEQTIQRIHFAVNKMSEKQSKSQIQS